MSTIRRPRRGRRDTLDRVRHPRSIPLQVLSVLRARASVLLKCVLSSVNLAVRPVSLFRRTRKAPRSALSLIRRRSHLLPSVANVALCAANMVRRLLCITRVVRNVVRKVGSPPRRRLRCAPRSRLSRSDPLRRVAVCVRSSMSRLKCTLSRRT